MENEDEFFVDKIFFCNFLSSANFVQREENKEKVKKYFRLAASSSPTERLSSTTSVMTAAAAAVGLARSLTNWMKHIAHWLERVLLDLLPVLKTWAKPGLFLFIFVLYSIH